MTNDFQNELLKVLQGINEDLSTLVDQMPTRRDVLAFVFFSQHVNPAWESDQNDFLEDAKRMIKATDVLITELDKKTEDFEFPLAKDESELP